MANDGVEDLAPTRGGRVRGRRARGGRGGGRRTPSSFSSPRRSGGVRRSRTPRGRGPPRRRTSSPPSPRGAADRWLDIIIVVGGSRSDANVVARALRGPGASRGVLSRRREGRRAARAGAGGDVPPPRAPRTRRPLDRLAHVPRRRRVGEVRFRDACLLGRARALRALQGRGEPGAPNRNPSSITPKSMATRGWRASAPRVRALACASRRAGGCVRERNGSAERAKPSRFQGGFQIRAGDVNAARGARSNSSIEKRSVFLSARQGSGLRRGEASIQSRRHACARAHAGSSSPPRTMAMAAGLDATLRARRAPTPSRAPPAAAPVAWSRVARSPSPRPKAR